MRPVMILVLRMSSCLHALACAFLCGYGSLTAPAGAAGLVRIHLGCLDILISLECFVLYAVFKVRILTDVLSVIRNLNVLEFSDDR